MVESPSDVRRRRLRWLVTLTLLVVTVLATVAVSTRLRLDPNVASLLPARGDAAALRRYLRAFGGSDLAMVLVAAKQHPGADGAPEPADEEAVRETEEVARGIAADLSALDRVRVAAAGIEVSGELDPLLIWRHADASARQALAQALTPDGMRRRLRGSRAMLLAPGAGGVASRIAHDPLRLVQLVAETRHAGSGFDVQADGSFASDDGSARLVLVFPEGQALRGDDAKAFVSEARGVLTAWQSSHPDIEIGLTGGHAIGEATERMLTADLNWSGTLSLLLASLAFALTFRRLRALLAVMPPLVLGTLWTAGIAAAMPQGLSAIAVAFMSVVIGVGVDTGVHVYAALLEARQEGLAPAAAARRARQRTQKPVLVAAATAGAAFGSLALSEIVALRQLGILCAGGEMLTAVAIVIVTPEIGALLERSAPPAPHTPRWIEWIGHATRTRGRAIACLVLLAVPLLGLAVGGAPELADAIVAMRPKGLEPLNVQQRIYERFGGRPGQWVVLVADPDLEKARERTDRIAEALATVADDVESVDSISTMAPAPSTQRARLAERDALDPIAKAGELTRALEDEGFAPDRFNKILWGLRHPPSAIVTLEELQQGDSAIMLSRYLGRDGPDAMVVTYVLPRLEPLPEDPALAAAARARNRAHGEAIERAVRQADPSAEVTGYDRLERSLRDSLLIDMPRIGAVAAALVLLALALSLRRVRDVALAAAVVAAEIGIVMFLIRVLGVPLHAYDALVLPVLLGITVDEGMFLLYRARATTEEDAIDEVLRREGPPVATTALTTAAGFAALVACDFDGLRHLGMVGAIGSVTGLFVALLLVPAGLRLWRVKAS